MIITYDSDASETVKFAADELESYLKRMLQSSYPELAENGWTICLGTDESDRHAAGDEPPGYAVQNDCFCINITKQGGWITGNNSRSVLLGIYDYLHKLGCRFLAPGNKYERVPEIRPDMLQICYKKQASFYHRGVCIEGADSYENIRDFIDWLPKVGYNAFFMQFEIPWAFLARYYHHERNPLRIPEQFSREDALECMRKLEREIKKRGLMLHKAGHGWTAKVLGFRSDSWDPSPKIQPSSVKKMAAQINGKRELFHGIPLNTNLCYHNTEATGRFADLIAEYAAENPQVDYLHVWLADDYNNVCECKDCTQTTLSDQYINLLNETDKRLTERGLPVKLVFLIYQELLWPPFREKLKNPDRFVLMFAPISRRFENSYSLENIPDELPEYRRNKIELPHDTGENLAFLFAWQKKFQKDSFIFDYPLGRAHYGDFGYLHIAEVISKDIKKLREMGQSGYMSCQELRAALPNALPNYVMGYTLFDADISAEELTDEYFEAAYGDFAMNAADYLRNLSALECCDYINGIGERTDEKVAGKMEAVRKCCLNFRIQSELYAGKQDDIFFKLLNYHCGYVLRFSEAAEYLAEGDKESAMKKWEEMRNYICGYEEEYEPFLDVYRVLEVTQNYTGFK